MENFFIGQRVMVNDPFTLPEPSLAKHTFLLIGMKVEYSHGKREVQFLLRMPGATGWPIMTDISPMERETYAISREFYNEDVSAWWLNEFSLKHPETIKKADGCQCSKCKDFIYMAPQQSNFVCRQCIQDPYRCSPVGGDDSNG